MIDVFNQTITTSALIAINQLVKYVHSPCVITTPTHEAHNLDNTREEPHQENQVGSIGRVALCWSKCRKNLIGARAPNRRCSDAFSTQLRYLHFVDVVMMARARH